jgi:hypothetical protein
MILWVHLINSWHLTAYEIIPSIVGMGPCKLKLNEEQGKHTDLAQRQCFGPVFLHSVLRLVKGTAQAAIAWKECNKYDLTAAPYFWLDNHIGPGGLLSVEIHFVFRGGVANN